MAYKEEMHCLSAMYVGRIIWKGAINWRLDASGVMRWDIIPETAQKHHLENLRYKHYMLLIVSEVGDQLG